MLPNVLSSDAYGAVAVNDDFTALVNIPPGSPGPLLPGNLPPVSITGDTAIVTNNTNVFGGYKNKGYDVVKIDLTPDRGTREIIGGTVITHTEGPKIYNLPGTFFWATWADDTGALPTADRAGAANVSAYAEVSFDEGPPIPFGIGFEQSGIPFQSFSISNKAQAGLRLWVVIVNDQPVDRVDSST